MNPSHFAGHPVIIGAGMAGLMTALHLAPRPVVIVTRAKLGAQSSSELAQGGLAAALGPGDCPERHLADTLAAGDGLCNADIARHVTAAAPRAIAALERFGVRFDRAPDGQPHLGLEAAHSRNRIVHAEGDGTGRAIVAALVAAVRATPSITVLEGLEARQLLMIDGAVAGVLVEGAQGQVGLQTSRAVIATGGIGGLFDATTNPAASWGQGLMLAAAAGAELADLEFIQFHPTALAGATRPMRLVSEAVRGEGAILVDETGRRFLETVPGAELAPRDVVARAVATQLAAGRRVYLDTRQCLGAAFSTRFPAIAAFCREAGIDPAKEPIPVRPAAHYHMGGIAVDREGRSTVDGLWACGEAACTGLHGANRLASNSLIEAAVCAHDVAESIAATPAKARQMPFAASKPPKADPAAIRLIVSRAMGVTRNGRDLRHAITALLPTARANDAAAMGLMVAVAALRREESRGGHFRCDFPCKSDAAHHSYLTLASALDEAQAISDHAMPLARSA